MLLIDDNEICSDTIKAIRAANQKRHIEAPTLAIGDVVEVVQPNDDWLAKGSRRTVVAVLQSSVCGQLVELDKPTSILWGAWRFRKVEATDEERAAVGDHIAKHRRGYR